MAFDSLTEREKSILYNLISYYIDSADPVGSRVIANRFKMGISSATIRNTLQDLEELGLVTQPHTSAGRIPTDLGYRVYVDYLVKPEVLTKAEKDSIRQSILKEGRGISEILGQTSRVLRDITNQLGVTTAPRFESGILKKIQLIPVSEERVMVVVVLKSGLARSVIIEIEAAVPESELPEFEQVLNERLAGLTLKHICDTISERIADVSGHGRLIKLMVDSSEKIWTEERPDDIHIAGAENLLSQPEFVDLDQARELVKILEDGTVLSDFLSQVDREGLIITIGRENKFNEIMNLSMVSSSYRVGNITGTIGIVGPTRMPYNKLVSIVEHTARTITDVLSGANFERD